MDARNLSVPLLLGALVMGGCGWQYAGEVERRRTVSARRDASPRPVVTPPVATQAPTTAVDGLVVPGARDLFTLGENHRASVDARLALMHQHAFEVRLVDALNDARQLVHCSSGKVVRFEKQSAAPGALVRLDAAGIPPGVWILEVDPSGLRPELPNNDWYRHIVKHHRLEYVDRHREHGTVLYRYLGPRRALSLR